MCPWPGAIVLTTTCLFFLSACAALPVQDTDETLTKVDSAGPEKLSVVLIGITGTGKSTLGNALLGRNVSCSGNCSTNGIFETCPGSRTCTSEAEAMDGFYLGDKTRPIRIIDTPGHGDSFGKDETMRGTIVDILRKEKFVHGLLWLKNAQAPRFDKQELEFLKILIGMYGRGFVDNLAIIFTRYSYSPPAQKRRQRSGNGDIESLKTEFSKSLAEALYKAALQEQGENAETEKLHQNLKNARSIVPMFAIDSMHDEHVPQEEKAFKDQTQGLWEAITQFSKRPVHDVKQMKEESDMLKEKIGELNQNMTRLNEEMVEMEKKGLQQEEEYKKLLQSKAEAAKALGEAEARNQQLHRQIQSQQKSNSGWKIVGAIGGILGGLLLFGK